MKKNILTIGCSNLLGMHHAFRQVFQHTQSNAKETETDLDVKIEKRTFTTILEDDYARYTNLSELVRPQPGQLVTMGMKYRKPMDWSKALHV